MATIGFMGLGKWDGLLLSMGCLSYLCGRLIPVEGESIPFPWQAETCFPSELSGMGEGFHEMEQKLLFQSVREWLCWGTLIMIYT